MIAINQTLQQELIHQYRIASEEKIKLIRLGIETNRYLDSDGQKRNQFRSEFGLPDDAIAIGRGARATGGKAVSIGSGNVASGNGAIYPEGDVAALGEQLLRLARTPLLARDWAERAGEIGRERLWPLTAQKFKQLFEQAISGAPYGA